ncbi:MAG: hypothetical protein KDA61_15015 [Planctomycetales bacterium]|nr:hypothetical protein [Planctomycetales bacterium]
MNERSGKRSTPRGAWLHVRCIAKVVAACGIAIVASSPRQGARADDGFPATWQPVEVADVERQVERWLQSSVDDAQQRQAAKQAYEASARSLDAPSADHLDRIGRMFAAIDPRAENLVAACSDLANAPSAQAADWLDAADVAPFVRANLHLLMARRLLQEGYYDECLGQLESVALPDVVEPATLLFCRMAAHHQLVEPEEARAALVQLLEQEDALPRRYQQLARLIEKDLSGLRDESLDHIARRMRDIRRRLRQGSAGDRVQAIERGVIESLDEYIKRQEDQQRQQQQQQSSGGSSGGATPMKDSMPGELKAPGKVDPRQLGKDTNWGDLPPREREQALEQVGREFPAHYREIIEQYFRELANEEDGP